MAGNADEKIVGRTRGWSERRAEDVFASSTGREFSPKWTPSACSARATSRRSFTRMRGEACARRSASFETRRNASRVSKADSFPISLSREAESNRRLQRPLLRSFPEAARSDLFGARPGKLRPIGDVAEDGLSARTKPGIGRRTIVGGTLEGPGSRTDKAERQEDVQHSRDR